MLANFAPISTLLWMSPPWAPHRHPQADRHRQIQDTFAAQCRPTAPYMHDGSVRTLSEAVDLELYSRGAGLSYPLALTVLERQDIGEFTNICARLPMCDE
jgi:hypothetical protein